MLDLCACSRMMVSLYSCDAAHALAMAIASEKVRASYRREKVGPHALFLFLSVCINIFVSSLYLYCLLANQK
jgi:hypothetical protein